VHEQHAGVRSVVLRLGQQRAVHVRVSARLEHQRPPQMIVVLLHPLTLLQQRPALDAREAVDDEPQGFTGSVGVNRLDGTHPGFAISLQPDMPILLSEPDVRIVLSMDDLIGAMETALVEFSAGRVSQPLRPVIEVGLQKAFFGVMPACIPEPSSAYVRQEHSRTSAGPRPSLAEGGALGAKLVTVFGSNPAAGLPTHLATIVLLDSMTGELLAVMDGRYITEARTAAVSAVSVKLLARERADTLAMIGSGVQARSHADAIGRVRPLRSLRVWSPNPDSRSAFGREMQPRTTAAITVCASAADENIFK
jgi:ornithine cyclodeaminase/alanine dehydrogenase-like protein (mu-crystallin family)